MKTGKLKKNCKIAKSLKIGFSIKLKSYYIGIYNQNKN